nr:DnaJ C-terminal domain-containing protein [Geomonas sp. RF6]
MILEIPVDDARRGAFKTIELVRVLRDSYGATQRVREFLVVEVPRGATAGSFIILRGHGSPGQEGGADGDLFLRLRIVPDD